MCLSICNLIFVVALRIWKARNAAFNSRFIVNSYILIKLECRHCESIVGYIGIVKFEKQPNISYKKVRYLKREWEQRGYIFWLETEMSETTLDTRRYQQVLVYDTVAETVGMDIDSDAI